MKKTTSGLSSGNACYHLVQNLLSSSYLPKSKKIKIQGTTIWLLFYLGV